MFFEHPCHMALTYDTNREIIDQAMAFLAEYYELFAFPHLDHFFPARAMNMPLKDFEKEFKDWPTNVAAIPKP